MTDGFEEVHGGECSNGHKWQSDKEPVVHTPTPHTPDTLDIMAATIYSGNHLNQKREDKMRQAYDDARRMLEIRREGE